jgi:hypothetical protein
LRDRCRAFWAVLLAAFLAGPVLAADRQYRGEFDPFPHDMSTRDNVVGFGKISATLAGDQLTVRGEFSGLSSSATAAFLRMGAAMGVPGPRIGEITVTKAAAGQISGTIKLNAAAIAALDRNGLYVELDSAKAPDGNSWAWLEADRAGMS